MRKSRIGELLEPFLYSANKERLTAQDLQQISMYIDILQRWNARINLTAIRNEEEIVTRHFGESLFAACHLFPVCVGADASSTPAERSSAAVEFDPQKPVVPDVSRNRRRAALPGPRQQAEKDRALAPDVTVADAGSGAGFPGIPIKLWAPEIALTL